MWLQLQYAFNTLQTLFSALIQVTKCRQDKICFILKNTSIQFKSPCYPYT